MKRRYGWKPSLPELPGFGAAWLKITAPSALPPSVDLRTTGFLPPVYDQGQLGSCTANSIAAAVDFERRKQGEPFITPSRLFIYYGERLTEGTVDSDSGAQISDGVDVVATAGVCPECEWPYDVSKFADKPLDSCYADALRFKAVQRTRIAQDENDIKHCLAILGRPVIFGFTVYSAFESAEVASTGILNLPADGEGVLGGHAVAAVGYDDAQQHFIVRNSWGADWGQGGYFFMPYAYLLNNCLASDLNAVTLES